MGLSALATVGLIVSFTFLPSVFAETEETEEIQNVEIFEIVNPNNDLSESDVVKQKKVFSDMRNDTLNREEVPIYRIVLTGGPCGGKSTAVATISNRLLSLGFRVFRVPEAATLLLTGSGINPGTLSEKERQVFETTMIKTKIALEDHFYNIAKAGDQPCVIICDRGTMDTAAYMSEESFHVMLDEENWNLVDLRDKRYDAIIHLVTAAIGAEKFYTTENNDVRRENLQQARDLDFKVLNAWIGHPRIRIVDNSTDFQNKISRIEQIICQAVGAPRPAKSERKFIVENFSSEALANSHIKIEKFSVEQTYLTPRNDTEENFGYNFVVRRGQNGQYTYTHSMIRQDVSDEKVILDRAISGREYLSLLKQSDARRLTVKKDVQFFLYNNNVYELQKFTEPDIGLSILRTEVDANKKNINFPWFVTAKGEISGIDEFSSYNISRHYHNASKDGNSQSKYNWKENQYLYDAYEKQKSLKKQSQNNQ